MTNTALGLVREVPDPCQSRALLPLLQRDLLLPRPLDPRVSLEALGLLALRGLVLLVGDDFEGGGVCPRRLQPCPKGGLTLLLRLRRGLFGSAVPLLHCQRLTRLHSRHTVGW